MSNVSLVDGHIDEPKMTDEEIIKALECCSKKECNKCPNYSEDIECGEALLILALDLINRLKAEIGGLKKFIEKDQGLILKLTNVPKNEYDNKIKSETIKEFAERFEYFVLHEDPEINELKCKDYESYMGGINQLRLQIVKGINNLVKEMVGE